MENNAPIIDENQAVELFEKRLENLVVFLHLSKICLIQLRSG